MQPEHLATYWGGVDFVRASTGLALKRMFMRAGSQSSMEFHVHKMEIYWIQNGVLKLGLRSGRGVNHSVTLKSGDCYEIPPGTMHMRMALTDVSILEACSVDSDDDTHIVFDGKSYVFEEG